MQKELSPQGPTAQQHDEQEAFEQALLEYAGIDPVRFKTSIKDRRNMAQISNELKEANRLKRAELEKLGAPLKPK